MLGKEEVVVCGAESIIITWCYCVSDCFVENIFILSLPQASSQIHQRTCMYFSRPHWKAWKRAREDTTLLRNFTNGWVNYYCVLQPMAVHVHVYVGDLGQTWGTLYLSVVKLTLPPIITTYHFHNVMSLIVSSFQYFPRTHRMIQGIWFQTLTPSSSRSWPISQQECRTLTFVPWRTNSW